ncbi:MAG: hypothetical protein AMS24_04860 [Chlamydiae bacterium SM23_39]|nr:MAG: hypothetical protein AMS24_04860 [Chlamydiae bacterium SM23_39]
MKKEYCSLIQDIITHIKSLEIENIFLSDEDYLFFEKDIKLKKRKMGKQITLTNKKNRSQITKKLPFSYLPEISEKKTYLKNKPFSPNISKPIQKVTLKDPEKFIYLEKPNKLDLPTSNIKKILSSEIEVVEEPLPDQEAQEISQNWKIKKIGKEISILYFKESPQGKLFLKNLAMALQLYFFPTKLISSNELEKENKWTSFLKEHNLKLIIASDYSLWQLPNLIKHFREIPAKKEYFLARTPFFMLPDISIYLKEPLLKKSLWHAICKKIKQL